MLDKHHKPPLWCAVQALTVTASGIALLAVLGYAVRQSDLISLTPQWQGMSILTAVGVVSLATISGRPVARSGPAWMVVFPVTTALIMLAALASHALYREDILSPWISAALAGMPAESSGRVSVATAACLLVLSLAAMARLHATRHLTGIIEFASNSVLLVAGAALIGYLYRVSDLYGLYVFNTLSLQSALSVACLALAILIGEPTTRLGMALRSPSLGVRQMRKMLALPAIPILLGWILLRLGGPGANGNGLSMAVLVSASGVPMFYLLLENAHAMDLLDRERTTQQKIEHRLTAELQIKLKEQTATLTESHSREMESIARADLAKRSEIIAQLTRSVAHDFNNLLMVIGGSAQLLKLRLRGGDLALMPLVDKVAVTVTRAAKLTGQLSAFSKTQRLQTTSVAVDASVRAALAETRTEQFPGISIVTELDAAAGNVLSEADQFQLAISHVLRNALEAMGEHGTLHVATSLRVMNDGSPHVVVRVTDNGVGMTPEQSARATEPFFTSKHGNHHGLGLAQTASVVQQASGVLHINPAPGGGTTVELVLPCIKDAANAVASAAQPLAPRAGNQRLLVIDDDDEVRSVLTALLRQMNYEVIEASNGEAALRLLDEHKPALAIIDFLMPGMNGAEVARRARSHSPDLSIVFISGFSDSDAIAQIPHSRLLRKPVVADELERTVADALQSA